MTADDPHADLEVLAAGPAPGPGTRALVALHGRGAEAGEMRELGVMLAPERLVVAPQAEGRTWYPASFMAPLERNRPHLDSALAAVDRIVSELASEGVPRERVAILGFSQGACLALEYAVRYPGRYDAVIALSGGLIGPPGTTWEGEGSLASTPAFLGCGDRDAHIPIARVRETAEAWRARGGTVDLRVYPGMGHAVNADEMGAARALVAPDGAEGEHRDDESGSEGDR